MKETTESVTLGAQTSGEDTKTMKHVIELRKLVADCCAGPYSSEVIEFALILRIGGDMREFELEGCEKIRRSKKEKYITVDLGFPSSRWKGASDYEIRRFLAEAVETGLLCCLGRLEKDRTSVDGARLLSDYAKAKSRFLGNSEGSA